MKKSLIAIAMATMVTAAPMVSTAAFAMENEISMLEQAVNNRFAALGISDYNMGDLTLTQLSTIRVVLASSDYNDAEKKQQIEAIIRNN